MTNVEKEIGNTIDSNNNFNIRWKDDGFDISEERTDEINIAIKALLLKIKVDILFHLEGRKK